ncbi:hypothetical protein SCHPADRAFT_898070 [Schizopora paradoxa]|uniref:Uncharacterized protein n=1 Tax=Schizopora paradoxa TaxID=27342 RepID=A0A0H2S7T6_9AGAM|nr:hypothetical protein SCHPADRAFT_898070 [Schizopora paradoxa]
MAASNKDLLEVDEKFLPATGDSGEEASLRRSVKTSLRSKASRQPNLFVQIEKPLEPWGLTSQRHIKEAHFLPLLPKLVSEFSSYHYLLELALLPTTPSNPHHRSSPSSTAGAMSSPRQLLGLPQRCSDSVLGRWHREVSSPFRLR